MSLIEPSLSVSSSVALDGGVVVAVNAAAAPSASAAAVAAVNHPITALLLGSAPHTPCNTRTAAASPLSLPVSLLHSIRGAVLSAMAEESELRLQLSRAQQAVTAVQLRLDSAERRSECSEQLKLVRDADYAASQTLLASATERAAQCERAAEQSSRQLSEWRAEVDEQLREAQQKFNRSQRALQAASKAGRDEQVARLGESLRASERRAAELQLAVDTERMARQAAEQRLAVAEQSAQDRRMEAAGRATDESAQQRIAQLAAQLAASSERVEGMHKRWQQAENDKRELHFKLERMKAAMRAQQQQQQQRTAAAASGSGSGDRLAGRSDRASGSGGMGGQQPSGKREQTEQAVSESRKKQK